MKFLLENWWLILTALVSGGMLLWPTLRGSSGASVTPNEAVNLINREKAVVIDVCEPAEHAAGHVSGARNIPLGSLSEGAKGLPANKTQPIVLVCQSGARSGRAVAILHKLGYENARSLAGGLGAWREANLPVAKG